MAGVMTEQQFEALAAIMRMRAGSANSRALYKCLVLGTSAYVASVSERASLGHLMEGLESVCATLERIKSVSPAADLVLQQVRSDVGQVIEKPQGLPLRSAETRC